MSISKHVARNYHVKRRAGFQFHLFHNKSKHAEQVSLFIYGTLGMHD